MNLNKYFLLLFIFSLCSCIEKKKVILHYNMRDEMVNAISKLKFVHYDTIESDFYYENLIQDYLEGDEISKGNGFIKCTQKISLETYLSGYFTAYFLTNIMEMKRVGIVCDSVSISKFRNDMFVNALKDGTYYSETKINPFCGAYYKKFHLKIQVLYLGNVLQRTPLCLPCEEHLKYENEHHNMRYQMLSLPTYLITKVFLWKQYKIDE